MLFVGILLTLFLVINGSFANLKSKNPNVEKRFDGPTSRIANGNEVVNNEFPWAAALIITSGKEIKLCSGSLISEDYIITSANCIDRSINIEIILGATKLNDVNDPGRMIINSKESIVHNNWNPKTYENDIGLVKLPAPIVYTDHIKPIKLWPSADDYWLGFHVNITGWGKRAINLDYSDTLIYATTSVRDHEVCEYIFPNLYNEKNHLCVGGLEGKSMCLGDEGGAVTFESDYRHEHFLIALASFSTTQSCTGGSKVDPSVYTYIYRYLDWINQFASLEYINI